MRPELTAAERSLLRRLADVGGRYTFKPDGEPLIAYRAFVEGIVAVLLSLQQKQLVRIEEVETHMTTLPDHPRRIAAIIAELTSAGREALR
jgi:hypothetical protein